MRFIVDGMHGKLARWLRLLGHDVEYYRSFSDKKLMELAVSENRILLTGDHGLYEMASSRGLGTVLVKADIISKILAMIANLFDIKLEVNLDISRCPKCNAELLIVAKDTVIDAIPDATAIYYSRFWRCSGCGQVYWQGAHWKRIQKTLDSANRLLCLL